MKHSWAVPVGISVLISLATILWNGGVVYGLDDAYIHMAVGKHCALSGTWGINAGEFQTATSSLAYPLVLCGSYRLLGVQDWIPLVVNLLCLSALVLYAKNRFNLDTPKLLAFYFLTFLPFLVVTGMEHVLHILLSVIFVGELLRKKQGALFTVVALALPLVRYESLALLSAGFVYLLIKRKLSLPILASGLTALASMVLLYFATGYPLPISMIVKSPYQISSVLSIFKIVLRFPYTLMTSAWFFSEYILSMVNFSYNKNQESRVLSFLFLVSAALHSQFGSIDSRYFAYLQALFILQFSNIKLKDVIKKIKPLTVVFLVPLVLMGSLSAFRSLTASHDIYTQQYQIAHFLKENYDGETIMLNDIGTTSFYSGVRVIDLVGLANQDVLEAKSSGEFGPEFMNGLAMDEGVEVAFVYDDWFPGQIPDSFEKAGELFFHFKVISGKSKISAYAIGDAERLRTALSDYEWPEEVTLEIM